MNIVFDLGGVVFNWQPDKIIKKSFRDASDQQRVKELIFKHPDWIELDRGTISWKQIIQRSIQRTGLQAIEIHQLFKNIPPSLTPIQETIDLLNAIKDTPNKLYILSNINFEVIKYLKHSSAIWDLFDGKVFSCLIQKVKPEPEIYQYLLNEYQLIPAETVFIDDMSENLIAASQHGIKTIHFNNAKQCHKKLQELGCI